MLILIIVYLFVAKLAFVFTHIEGAMRHIPWSRFWIGTLAGVARSYRDDCWIIDNEACPLVITKISGRWESSITLAVIAH